MSDVDWLATRNQIIYQALSNIGVVPIGEDPSPEQLDLALFHLNSITKFLETKNLFLWNYSEEMITTTPAVASNAFTNNDAIGVDLVWYLSNSNKVFLEIIDKDTYDLISNKATAGTPNKAYFARGTVTPALLLYPVPAVATTIYARTARRLKDWDTAAGNAWPSWWVEPIVWKLAANLSHPFRLALPERDRLEVKATGLMAEAFADNFKQNDLGEVIFHAD